MTNETAGAGLHNRSFRISLFGVLLLPSFLPFFACCVVPPPERLDYSCYYRLRKKRRGKEVEEFLLPSSNAPIHTYTRTNAKPLLTFPLCRAKQNTETRREIKVGEAFCVLSRTSFPPSVLFFFFAPFHLFRIAPLRV